MTEKELELGKMVEQLTAQIGHFRDLASKYENFAIKKKNEEGVWQLVILSLFADHKVRGIDINVETFDRLRTLNKMKLVKKWNKDGSLTVKLVEKEREE